MAWDSRNVNFAKRHILTEMIKVGNKTEVPRWRYDWKVTNRSKYKPHQGKQECERRK